MSKGNRLSNGQKLQLLRKLRDGGYKGSYIDVLKDVRKLGDGGPVQDAPYRPESPVQDNREVFSHKMASANWGGKEVGYPTVFPTYKGTPSRTPQSDDVAFWTETDNQKFAYLNALRSGELRTFDNPNDARAYGEGAWKAAPMFNQNR